MPMSSPQMTTILGLPPPAGRCVVVDWLGSVPWARAAEISPVATTSDVPLSSIARRLRRVLGLVSFFIVFPLKMRSDDTAETDMTHSAVDHLCVTSGWPVATTVVGRAQKGATFDHFARNAHVRLGRVVAEVYTATAGIVRHAAGGLDTRLMTADEPIGRPFPDISDHIEQTISVRGVAADRSGAFQRGGMQVPPGKFAFPGVRHPDPAGRKIVAPSIFGSLQSAARRELPLRFCWQCLAAPPGVSCCVFERDVHHGMIEA